MSEKKIILRNIFSSLIEKIVSTIYGIIIPILIIKQYGSEVNGLVSSITQFISYIVLLEFGIGPVVKYAFFKPLINKNANEVNKVLGATDRFFKRIAGIFIIYLILLCVIYPHIIDGFNYWYTVSLIIIIGVSRLFEYFLGMTYSLFLQADQKNYVIDYTTTVAYILSIILILILLKLNFSIQIVKLIGSLAYIIRPIVLKIYFKHKYKYKILKKDNYKLPQQWDALFHHIAATVQSNVDVVVLTIFNTLSNVSIYYVYSLITNGLRTIILSLTNGIDAFFGKVLINDSEESVKNKFEIYTFFFYTITTIILSSSIVLIIPFISVYTKGITDANYINEIFAYVMIFAEYTFVIRYPFSDLTFAKGHFKQTKNFSIVEPIVNIILSIIFVIKFGLVGVALGTLISMAIRTIGFIVYASKNILNVKVSNSFKIIIISYIEMIIIFIVHILIGNVNVINYFEWIKLGLIVFIIISIFIITVNCLLLKNTSKKIFNILKIKKK